MSLRKRFLPRLESFEDRSMLSAALPLLTAAPTGDPILKVFLESADVSSPSVLVHAEQDRESTMLVAQLTQVPASPVVLVLGGQSRLLDKDGTVRWPMPRETRSAILALRTDNGTNVPVLRVEFDEQGRMVRQIALTDLRSALRQRLGMQETMMDDMGAMQDASGRSMSAMTSDQPAMTSTNTMPLGDDDLAMMRSADMAMGRGPMSGHGVFAAGRGHGDLGAEWMKPENHAADPWSEAEPLLAGEESGVHGMRPSADVANAVLSGAFTNPAGSGFVLPIASEPVAPRYQPLDPSTERGPAALDPDQEAGKPRRLRAWEAAVAGAVAVAALRGAYVLEKQAQGTGSDLFSCSAVYAWLNRTTYPWMGSLHLGAVRKSVSQLP